MSTSTHHILMVFPFLFGGTFIEGVEDYEAYYEGRRFPFLFGGTFIEGSAYVVSGLLPREISLPFRRDFH